MAPNAFPKAGAVDTEEVQILNKTVIPVLFDALA